MLTHYEATDYIAQVRKALDAAGTPVAHLRIDTEEQATECGRQWACIDLAGDCAAYCLVWSDWGGWMVGTHADHYPLLEDQFPCPDPAAVATAAASCIHALRHGAHLRHLRRH